MRVLTAMLTVCLCAGELIAREDVKSLTARLRDLYRRGDYAGATKVAEQAVDVAELQFGKDAAQTANSINNLGELYRLQGKYAEAEPLLKRALMINEKALGPDHAETATSLNNLSLLYHAQGNYAEAESLNERALAIREKALGSDHPDTANSLNNLAGLYISQGKYAEAEPLYQRALAISEKALGLTHPDTTINLNNLAALYFSQGKYAEAEPLYKQALAIGRRSLGSYHPDMAARLNNLAALYVSQGKYAEAEPLIKQALMINEKALGPDHPATAHSLRNVAELYRQQRKYSEAEPLLKRALAINEKSLGSDHVDTAQGLSNLAMLYHSQGKYAEAVPLDERALAIREKLLGPRHLQTAESLNNLSALYYMQGKYAEAEPLSERASAIREKALGTDHPATAQSLNNLAVIQVALRRLPDAVGLADRVRHGIRRHVARVLPSLSAAEQMSFLRSQDERPYHFALSLGLLQKSSPYSAELSAGWLANGKAVAQEALSQQILLARHSDSARTTALVRSLAAVRTNIAKLSHVIPGPEQASAYRAKVTSLQQRELQLVSDIGGRIAAVNRAEPWVETDAVRKNIPSGGVLVDIARFNIFDLSDRYAAWIVPPDGAGAITIVDLGDAAEIDTLVADYRRSVESRATDTPAAKPLAAKVLQPILAAMPSGGGKVEELILSPDGALWLVPWQALPLEDGRYAIEKYTIRTVISGRSLVPPPPSAKPLGETTAPIVMADPDFDRPTPAGETKASSGVTGRFLEPVEPLPNTTSEAEAARGALGSLAGVEPIVKLGRDATETELKTLAVRPKVLVLATHGFFLPDQEIAPDDRLALGSSRTVSITRPVDKSGKPLVDPLLRCGLLLAGANQTLSGQPTGSDDGILTGAEIVGLDLLGTDLVVLSACETGVGDVRNGEGVAGLRQAFQIAGAPTVVSTLWRVPDAESAAIMTDFYQHLAAGKSASVALREAQLGFIAAKREGTDEKAVSPYLWAAYGVTGR